jgi:hypothetical protein
MGRGLRIVKRSGRDEPMLVVIHKCLEAMLRISLYSYLYLKLAKMICLSYYLLYFLFNKIGEQEVGTFHSCWSRGIKYAGQFSVHLVVNSNHYVIMIYN